MDTNGFWPLSIHHGSAWLVLPYFISSNRPFRLDYYHNLARACLVPKTYTDRHVLVRLFLTAEAHHRILRLHSSSIFSTSWPSTLGRVRVIRVFRCTPCDVAGPEVRSPTLSLLPGLSPVRRPTARNRPF